MAKNEKMSCSSNYRHTGIQFFWAEDRMKQEKISVKYCSTEKNLEDLFPKPLQSSKFNFFRRVIMGWDVVEKIELATL